MNTKKLVITHATTKDAAILTQLSIVTFRATFDVHNKKEDMDKYVADEMNETKLTEELNDNDNTFLLAHYNNTLTGYVKLRINKEPEELKNNHPIEIERIYVLHEYHNKKIGAALMQYCIDYAISKQHDVIWLGVWEHNHHAVNFYKKWRFEFFGTHPFLLGNDIQTDVLMKKKL